MPGQGSPPFFFGGDSRHGQNGAEVETKDYLEFIARLTSFRVIDTCPGPGYPYFVRGRIDLEREAGDSMPREKGISYP